MSRHPSPWFMVITLQLAHPQVAHWIELHLPLCARFIFAMSDSAVDTDTTPSVRARLAELRSAQSSPRPQPTRRPPPPLPTTKRAPPPPPPTSKRPPPPPPPTTAPKKPPLPTRKSVANGIVPPPARKPELPVRAASTRSLPPVFNSVEALPVVFSKKEAVVENGGHSRSGSVRSIPPLPSRSKTTPAPALPTRSNSAVVPPPAVARRTLPPPDAPIPKPPSVRPLTGPPKVPTSTRPPPIPTASRPDPATLRDASVFAPPCLFCMDFSAPDAVAASPHLARTTPGLTVASLAHELTSPFAYSSTLAARAIFTWLHHNVDYDLYALQNNCIGPQNPDTVLRTGMSVCQGYAELFVALCTAGGIKAEVVSGHGKGVGYAVGQNLAWPPSGHAWSAYWDDAQGGWRLVDACWGAGALMNGVYTRRFAEENFVASAADFGRSHYASDERWNLGGWSWQEYEALPERVRTFGGAGELGLGRIEPELRRLQGGRTVRVAVKFGKCDHTRRGIEKVGVMLVDVDGKQTVMEMDHDRTGWSADVWLPAGVQKMMLYRITKWDGRSGDGLTVAQWRKQKGKVGYLQVF
ncbi:hypothetical protein EDC01DRAFT_671805 [Geopyxis carbonaria]|nr:hypothetical protein EDC01DRAFT_671805 [Geopyxis carbonaria]